MGTLSSRHISEERLLHFTVFVAQLMLAGFFSATAAMKLVIHPERLVEVMAWTETVPLAFVRALGAVELLGAIMVAAPAVTRAPQRVVGWAAVAFATLMASAAVVHIARGELRMVALNLVVLAIAAFVVWGRLGHKPLESIEQP